MKQFYETETGGADRAATGYQSIEDLIYTENVHMYEMAFEQQYHFGVFYAWVKLREQEIRNIRWIANMVVLSTKDSLGAVEMCYPYSEARIGPGEKVRVRAPAAAREL